jgi:hypothetical protein
MHALSDNGVLIIAGSLLVIGLIAYFTFKSYTGITLSALSIALDVSQTATVTAKFRRKRWLLAGWQDVPGSFHVRPFHLLNPVVAASPATESTDATLPMLTVTVTGIAPGYDTVRISGTPVGETEVESIDLSASVLGD